MKTWRWALCLLPLMVGCISPSRPLPLTEMEVRQTTRFIGAVSSQADSVTRLTWWLCNAGHSPMRIDSVLPSCDCLSVTYDATQLVMPKDSIALQLVLRPEGATGPFFREIDVYGNFPSPMTLTIEGEWVDEAACNKPENAKKVGTGEK